MFLGDQVSAMYWTKLGSWAGLTIRYLNQLEMLDIHFLGLYCLKPTKKGSRALRTKKSVGSQLAVLMSLNIRQNNNACYSKKCHVLNIN